MVNTLRAGLVALVTTVWYASRILFASIRRGPGFAELAQELPRRWARAILRAARVEVRLEGFERIPLDRSTILVANHESWFDVFALVACLPGEYRFVGKIELTRIPFFGPAWQSAGHIAIDRGDRQKAIESLEIAREVLHRERAVVVMFPEGTRTPHGDLLPFKKGAFVLAGQADVPLVPAGIGGSRAIMPKGSWRVRPGTIVVRVGSPIHPRGAGAEERDRLLAESRRAVEELRRPLPPSA